MEFRLPVGCFLSSVVKKTRVDQPLECVKIVKMLNSGIPASGRMNSGGRVAYPLLSDAKNSDPIGSFVAKIPDSGVNSVGREMYRGRVGCRCRLRGRNRRRWLSASRFAPRFGFARVRICPSAKFELSASRVT